MALGQILGSLAGNLVGGLVGGNKNNSSSNGNLDPNATAQQSDKAHQEALKVSERMTRQQQEINIAQALSNMMIAWTRLAKEMSEQYLRSIG